MGSRESLVVPVLLLMLSLPRLGAGLKIGAFNIQVFGQSKSNKPDVMAVLVKIVQRYDILLIQEIRDSEGTAIERLLNAVNEKEKENTFSMEISDRLGRTTSKEQYAFFYRRGSGLRVAGSYHYDDGSEEAATDTFEREPFIVRFRSTKTVLDDFAIGGNHISPSKAEEEITELENVFKNVAERFGISDVMMMGDLNADCSYLSQTAMKRIPISSDPDYTWWITDDMDTTVAHSSCAYDRFISTGSGFKSGIRKSSVDVFRFDEEYGLTLEQAKDVSDHYPIELDLIPAVISGGQHATSSVVAMAICSVLVTVSVSIL